jgi:hypothetical protein
VTDFGPLWGCKSKTGGLFDPEICKNVSYETNRRGAAREKPLAFRALATGARDRPATARKTAVACGRHIALDMVQAAEAGAGRTASAIFARAESFAAELTRDLARCAALERESMAIIAELTAYAAAAGGSRLSC